MAVTVMSINLLLRNGDCMNDFIKDFRFGDDRDGRDHPFHTTCPAVEFSDCNRNALLASFTEVRDRAKAILEIGVCRNGFASSTFVFLNNKKDDTIYLGVDLESKAALNNAAKNVHTLVGDSSDTELIMRYANSLKIKRFDYIFIDGFHSVNQVIRDWAFVEHLADGGIVGLHDTNRHPGPVALLESINESKWEVIRLCQDDSMNVTDNGIAFIRKRV